MSEPSQETRGVRARFSRWRARTRGRSTLKAAYAQAARDVKRMDPAVRERIGRAHLTRADLQQLANFHVDAQFRPGRYGALSERLGDAARARLQESGPTPRQPRISRTRNPVRALVNRYSRWGRNERRGTKALKAALQQAAKDVRRTDPRVLEAIGRSTLNSADLASLASGRMDQVFRPEGRLGGLPGQQQGRGSAQGQASSQTQAQAVQSPDQAPQVPQQSEQMTQRIAALQQSILENQQRAITLMEENNRLQAEMRQLLQARVQDLQQQVTDLGQAVSPPQLTQEPARDPARESPEGQQPQRDTADDHVRLDNPIVPTNDGEQQTPGETEAAGEQQSVGEEPEVAPGEQEQTGGQVQEGDRQVAPAEPLDMTEAMTRIAEGDQNLAGAEIQDGTVVPATSNRGEAAKSAELDEVATAAKAAGAVAPPARSTAEEASRTAKGGKDDGSKNRPALTPRDPSGRDGR
ncbi:hypothetical protein [Kribbella sp. HUAS MG21]|uniref:Uncharacterized protein n=1 Tax=Kribbella sp. HUAS MG21 TaxID=3160966 RepID=A0AAU7TPF3_9ACTN